MYESITQIRVRYAETDQMNVVYYGNYAQYFEVGRVESIRQLGYTYKDMEEQGVMMPVVELNIKYLRPATYDDLLTVKTQIREMPHDHRIEFHQEVFNEKGKLLTAGNVKLYFLETKTWKKTTMPEAMRVKLQPYFAGNPVV
ncbi:acyl-CoA thioesterase [Foetidibacter luteolus]|uniref:acyl-CoA thioesterase n=1 Tax=Foetidibacter luteolus TaxID=2608880 RepID=UPI00129B2437|nr:thioesterase family protein [Foetidibacter luteolus]